MPQLPELVNTLLPEATGAPVNDLNDLLRISTDSYPRSIAIICSGSFSSFRPILGSLDGGMRWRILSYRRAQEAKPERTRSRDESKWSAAVPKPGATQPPKRGQSN